ncbi:MAG: sulfatase-like hydrolase/transferase [Caldilineaceae bacterium]
MPVAAHDVTICDTDGLYRLRAVRTMPLSPTDRKVGELFHALAANGLAGNTVVVFTSDHGDMLCEKEMAEALFSTNGPVGFP